MTANPYFFKTHLMASNTHEQTIEELYDSIEEVAELKFRVADLKGSMNLNVKALGDKLEGANEEIAELKARVAELTEYTEINVLKRACEKLDPSRPL